MRRALLLALSYLSIAATVDDSRAQLFIKRYSCQGLRWRNTLTVKTAEQSQRFQYRQLFGQPGFLQRDSKDLPDIVIGLAPLHSMNLDVAPGGIEQSLKDFNRRGFTCAVWAQQSETFTRFDLKIQTIHGIDRRFSGILLVELAANNRFGHAKDFSRA